MLTIHSIIISIILIFPVISGVLTVLIKRKAFSNFMLNLYGVLHFLGSMYLIFSNEANFNKYFTVDNLNKIFLLILSFVFLMVVIYNNGYTKNLTVYSNRKACFYSNAVITFVAAMTGAILATDLGTAWVLVEATTLASAYLIYFNKTKSSIEAAWKYVFMCSIGIALAFVGIIFLNISSGGINSLNYTELSKNVQFFNIFWLKLSFIFILFGFGTKMGLAPVHFWLPDAHSESPSPVSALLSATLLNSAYLVILRVFNILNITGCSIYGRIMLAVMGFLSLFVAAVFIYHIKNYKRMLAYSSIENMGILAIGTALFNGAHYAVILHLLGHSFVKASFFLTSGNILELFETKRIKSTKSIMTVDKNTAWLWIDSFIAICAFPTSVLFISEFLMIKKMIASQHYVLCVLFVLLLTVILFGMGKAVLNIVFNKPGEEKFEMTEKNKEKLSLSMYIPQTILLAIVFILGVYIPPFLHNIINMAGISMLAGF